MIKDATHNSTLFTPWRLACLCVLIASGAVYLPAMGGLAVWDDHALIGGTGIGGGKSMAACFTQPFLLHYFRPLVSLSFFVDHKVFGTGPFFYHQTNLIIHVLTTFLCLLLFRAVSGNRSITLFGALVFAVQPAQVSTVAWIGGRTDSLCTLWVTLFAWSLVRSAQEHGRNRSAWSALSVLGFALALFTKEQALSLLCIVPLSLACFGRHCATPSWKSALKYCAPYLVVSAMFVATWCAFYPSPMRPVMHSVPEQFALAGRTLSYYGALLFLPTPAALHLLSAGPLERWGPWPVAAGYALLAGLLLACRRNLASCPSVSWYCGFLLAGALPVCNIIPLPSLALAPYRVGICGPAAAGLLGCLVATIWSRTVAALRPAGKPGVASDTTPLRQEQDATIRHAHTRQPVAWASGLQTLICASALIWCGGLTWWGAGRWQDESTVFSTFVRYDPDSIVARFNLSTALLKQHRTSQALSELDGLMTRIFRSPSWRDRQSALALLYKDPKIFTRIRENQGNAIQPEDWLAALYAQRGFALLAMDEPGAALRMFDIGRAIERTNDDVNLGLAQIAFDARDFRTAVGCLRVVLAIRPQHVEAHMLLGHTYVAMGRWRHARAELEAWASLTPWNGQAQIEVAQARLKLGDYDGARATLQYALRNSICNAEDVRARIRDIHGHAARFLN